MFSAHLMDNTPTQVFVDNGATPSNLPLSTYNKHPMLQKYPHNKKDYTHPHRRWYNRVAFWIELPLKLDN